MNINTEEPMRIYMLRHAAKLQGAYHNPRLRHQDEPISDQGRLDSERLWKSFAGRPIAAIYISEYRRTGETIEYVAERCGLMPIVDPRLNEIDNGLIEGLADEEIRARYPEVWQGFTERAADFRFPGGETGEEVRYRVASFLEEKRRQHASAEIIAVAHDGLIRLTTCHVLGLPVYRRWDFHIDFCGLVEFVAQGDAGWKLIRFNQAC